MVDTASERFYVDFEPAPLSRSFWKRLLFSRLTFTSNLAAESNASKVGANTTALPGNRIVIREIPSGDEVWQLAITSLTGGTTPNELLADIQEELNTLSVEEFVEKRGIAER